MPVPISSSNFPNLLNPKQGLTVKKKRKKKKRSAYDTRYSVHMRRG